MNDQHRLAALLIALSICTVTPFVIVLSPAEFRLLPGELWQRGDGLGYNVTLNLGNDGRYKAIWEGDLGEYGRSEGKWHSRFEQIVLEPLNEQGMMRGHLRQLLVVTLGAQKVLVPPEDVADAIRWDTDSDTGLYAFKLSKVIDENSPLTSASRPTR